VSICLAAGCNSPVNRPRFLCKPHWFQVPRRLRDEIWRLYSAEPGSPDHVAALRAAVRGVRA
jgi:hypothetical protein